MDHFNPRIIPPDVRQRMMRARALAMSLQRRPVNCPYCGFLVTYVFSNTAGNVQAKCKKCKQELVFFLTPGTNMDFRRARTK